MSDPTRFILVETSHPGNVGSVARAMRVMGFSDLVLVRPRFADVLRHPEALAMASGAVDVLEGARVVEQLTEALDGIQVACATAMTPRDFGPPTRAPRDALPDLGRSGQRVAFVMGSERYGLCNDDVYACHFALSIPTTSDYGSLNLAMAVQVLAYEWRLALGGFEVLDRRPKVVVAEAQAVQDALLHWREALEAIGYLDPAAPKKLMARLNQMVNRATISEQELHIFRGVARAIIKSSRS